MHLAGGRRVWPRQDHTSRFWRLKGRPNRRVQPRNPRPLRGRARACSSGQQHCRRHHRCLFELYFRNSVASLKRKTQRHGSDQEDRVSGVLYYLRFTIQPLARGRRRQAHCFGSQVGDFYIQLRAVHPRFQFFRLGRIQVMYKVHFNRRVQHLYVGATNMRIPRGKGPKWG